MSQVVQKHEPTVDDLERVADRLTGHGINGLVAADWPILMAALYIAIRCQRLKNA